jgi:hypothetical protein
MQCGQVRSLGECRADGHGPFGQGAEARRISCGDARNGSRRAAGAPSGAAATERGWVGDDYSNRPDARSGPTGRSECGFLERAEFDEPDVVFALVEGAGEAGVGTDLDFFVDDGIAGAGFAEYLDVGAGELGGGA